LVSQLREQENISESLILIGATSQRRSRNLSVATLLQASFHDYVPDRVRRLYLCAPAKNYVAVMCDKNYPDGADDYSTQLEPAILKGLARASKQS
jgi:hypothetical protein